MVQCLHGGPQSCRLIQVDIRVFPQGPSCRQRGSGNSTAYCRKSSIVWSAWIAQDSEGRGGLVCCWYWLGFGGQSKVLVFQSSFVPMHWIVDWEFYSFCLPTKGSISSLASFISLHLPKDRGLSLSSCPKQLHSVAVQCQVLSYVGQHLPRTHRVSLSHFCFRSLWEFPEWSWGSPVWQNNYLMLKP